jgi:hypothetical protein
MNPILRFFSHPIVVILSSVANLIAVPMAFYFYYAGIRAPNLTFHFHPVRTTIVKAGGASALKVLFAGSEVQSDITAVQIAFWNAGKEPIPAISVLAPVQVKTEKSVPILEATLRKTSRPLSQIALDETQLANGIIGMKWKILEQDDGGIIQLIYAGSVENKLSVSGAIIGQKHLSELKYSGSISTPAEQYAKQARENRLFGWLMIGCGLAFSIFGFLARKVKPPTSMPRLFRHPTIVMTIPGLAYTVIGFVMLYQATPPRPPFGF